MNKSPLLSIIILNYNSEQFLPDLFRTLAAQTFTDYELLFVDNASSDKSLALAEKLCREHKLEDRMLTIANKDNLGFCLGNNRAAEQARGKYLLFLNVDTKIDERCLEKLIESAETDPKIGVWQSYILNFDNTFRTSGNNLDIYAAKAQPKEWRTFFASGACVLLPNSLFTEIRGFDKEFFLINDDADLSWRARLMGYGVDCARESVCYHWGNYATIGITARSVYFQQRNRIRMVLKNYAGRNVFKRLPLLLLLVFLFGVYHSIDNKNPRYFFSIARAYLWNIGKFRDTMRERKLIQRSRKVADAEIEKHMIPYASELYSFGLKFGLGKPGKSLPDGRDS